MLPLHLMSLHEISKREERTMALCVKKPNSTCMWDDQTATTAASPSTSTPPSTAESTSSSSYDGTTSASVKLNRLLRRLWRELNLNDIVCDDDVDNKARACQHPTAALQFSARVGWLPCRTTGLSADVSPTADLRYGRRNGSVCLGDRLRNGLRSEARPQQRWLQLRKYWRHNARRRLRKIERDQYIKQLSVDGGISKESSTYVPRTDNEFQAFANIHPFSHIHRSDKQFIDEYNFVCRYSSKDPKELLWRQFRFIEFCGYQSGNKPQQQQYHLQQTKLRKLQEFSKQQEFSARIMFQYFNETTQGQSNNIAVESSKVPTRSSSPYNASELVNLFVVTKFHDQLSDELYTDKKGRNTWRRTICDSMSPIFLARFRKLRPTETFTRVSKRTRPSVYMLQSITLESHSRNR